MKSKFRWIGLCACTLAALGALGTLLSILSFRVETIRLIDAGGGEVKARDSRFYRLLNRLLSVVNGPKVDGPLDFAHIGPQGDIRLLLTRLERERFLTTLFIEDAGDQELPLSAFDQWSLLNYIEIRRGQSKGILSHLSPSVTAIYIKGSGVSDEDLEQCSRFGCLKMLSLQNNPITDLGISQLKGLTIEALDLSGTKITNKSGATLATIHSLRNLFVNNTAVSSTLIERMGVMPGLENFGAANTDLDDEGVCLIARTWKLRDLTMYGTKVSHRAIECACEIEGLTSLSVGGSIVREVDLDSMGRHPTLAIIDLVNCDSQMTQSLDLSRLLSTGKGVYFVVDNGLEQTRVLAE